MLCSPGALHRSSRTFAVTPRPLAILTKHLMSSSHTVGLYLLAPWLLGTQLVLCYFGGSPEKENQQKIIYILYNSFMYLETYAIFIYVESFKKLAHEIAGWQVRGLQGRWQAGHPGRG